MTEWTVGTDGKIVDISISRKTMTFKEARRLKDQLEELLPPSETWEWDCRKPRPKMGFIYPTDWNKR